MQLGLVGQAIALFVVTNIDDIVILALFFGQAVGRRNAVRVIVGQYLGFGATIALSIVGAIAAGLLPEAAIPYLGLLPLALGLHAAWTAWRDRHDRDDGVPARPPSETSVFTVAAVTLANGGDNIGVYVPVFATSNTYGIVVYVTVFLMLVGVWCAAGYYFATRPVIARALSRWGHILLPVVLIAIGLAILVEGHAFGL